MFQNKKVVLEALTFLEFQNMYGVVVQTYILSLVIIYLVRTLNVCLHIRR